ncbi:MAG: hypothetical protein JXR95_13580 [Deltaproteobacteria bacterium]|nr:hypothetical protein [Deltaproteobacteria bacterium]
MKRSLFLVLAAVFGVSAFAGCGTSKKKAREDFNKYVKASNPIIIDAGKHYHETLIWLGSYTDAKKDEYKKKIGKRTDEYKKFVKDLDAVKAPNKKLVKIRENDVKMLHCTKEIYKEYKSQLEAGKKPHENERIKELTKEYKMRDKRFWELRREYKKKYGGKTKRSKSHKKFKKRKKHK